MKKIIGIVVVTLLIGTVVLPVLGTEVKYELQSISLDSGWIKHFEGTKWSSSVIQTSDGGYLVAGGTGYYEGSDALLIKTDAEGNQQWETTFGGTSGWDAFDGLVETSDGGFAASGIKAERGFLAKVDAGGNALWEKTYGGSTDGWCMDVRQTEDNGFITTGLYYEEPRRGWLIKTDSEGNEEWSKTYGEEYPVRLYSVGITDDGGFILAGSEENPDKLFPISWAVKTHVSGNVEWENFYESANKFRSGVQTLDGGYIFVGDVTLVSTLNIRQSAVVKTDADGNEVWSKNFGLPIFQESSFCVEETSDGGLVVIGHYMGFGTLINELQNGVFLPFWSKMWLLKIDADGNLEWDKKIETGIGRSVKQTADGGFIVTGVKGAYNYPKGILLIKTDQNGNIN